MSSDKESKELEAKAQRGVVDNKSVLEAVLKFGQPEMGRDLDVVFQGAAFLFSAAGADVRFDAGRSQRCD